ncbi:CBS domain-containing protein [Streptomyces sp. NBC_01803]|uniref:CBS domain-containing protein n=1 Tax=Streptomyces sp. NBC_01803 TaxID=2975946 RepID=UPI002DD7EFDA|nr:CBS domain-containing protein [Streptomyces sp. NBC_01803]WSA47348.1 CBS domain-containing protein [Streptomyces sp. NBC_01803]
MKQRMVGTVMTGDVVSVTPEVPFKRVAEQLAEHRVSGMPVVDDDEKVLGVVSEQDLMARQAKSGRRHHWPPTRVARRETALAGAMTAGELMTAPAITVRAVDSVARAARVMADRQVKRLPVLDEEDRLVGIVSRRDVLGVFLRPDAEIRQTVTDEVLIRSLWLPRDAVRVTVEDGVVTLDGVVERESEIPIALSLTGRMEGVVGVVDRLTAARDDSRLGTGIPEPHGVADH